MLALPHDDSVAKRPRTVAAFWEYMIPEGTERKDGAGASATKSVFARVVISTVELYRQLYRQKHSTGEISIQGVNHDRGRASDKLARPPDLPP